MKIIKYTCLEDLEKASLETEPVQMLFHTDISSSFRIYDSKGNTKQFHVFYK